MKFFTLEWWRGEVSEAEYATAVPAYAKHFAAIRDRLPEAFRKLNEEGPSLHDAHLVELNMEPASARVRLAFRGFDKNIRFELTYEGLVALRATGHPEGLSGSCGFGDMGYHELDLAEDGSAEHRLLFSSGVEISVRFASFAMRISDVRPDPAG